jgi:hypothetical protein
MELENQVCSLEAAKKLKELGVKQNGYFEYLFEPLKDKWSVDPAFKNRLGISAFTAAELLQLLPVHVDIKEEEPFNRYSMVINRFYLYNQQEKMVPAFIVNYECDSCETTGPDAFIKRKMIRNIYDENLANILANMFIYLVEKGLIDERKI